MSSTHFGFETVPEQEKARRVRGVFDSVASKYDVMNDLMSAGLHRAWKAYTVMVTNPSYMLKMWQDGGGQQMLLTAMAMQIIGSVALWRMVRSV